MTDPQKRVSISRGKGLLSAPGPQARFILFLVLVLIAYTFLLKLFQKLAAVMELPVFFPIAFITMLLFVGVAGALYSHRFAGPLTRIRRTIEQIAAGECSATLRLRETDDPMLKELVQTITQLCENSRNARHLADETSRDLLTAISALQAGLARGASPAEVQALLDDLRRKQEPFEKALRSIIR